METGGLVAGRDCGECTMCCIVLGIDDSEIQKTASTLCRHCTGSGKGGCSVYANRPRSCRTFFCAWRQLGMLDDDWRPDRSGIFAFLDPFKPDPAEVLDPGQPPPQAAITLMLTNRPEVTVREQAFVMLVSLHAANGLPVYLSLPAPPGYMPHRVLLYSKALTNVAKQNPDHVRAALEQALAFMASQPFRPQVFQNRGNDVSR